MLLTVTPLENPGPPSPVPPPTAPKPSKDNARLQRLLRKAAKRSGAQPLPTQSPKTFRSTLSPVTEGDMESPEPAAAAQKNLLSPITLPPRFQIRGVVHRVPSPYPKQRSFTFTVPEQQSLNQYLSPSPIPDTPSPRPFGSSGHENPFLFPSGGSTADHVSLRVNVNASPRPCTPRHVTFNPTPTTQPAVPLIPVADIPVIIVPETEPGLELPNKEENIEIQRNPIVPITEIGHSTLKSQLSNQQTPINISISCSTVSVDNNPATLQAATATSETTNKAEILECSRVAENVSNTSTLPSKPTDVNQATNPAHTTDGSLLSVVEVKSTNPPPEVKSVQKPVNAKAAVSEIHATTAKLPNSEETNLLKSPERPKPPRKKPGGGWARLMKHLVVEPDEPKFPEPEKTEGKEEKKDEVKQANTETTQQSRGLRANKMWDALLYHMATSTKVEEKPTSEEESTPKPASAPATPQFPFLRFRLPLLLHRPRFDARKLKEAASRPLRKVTAFFHRRISDKSSTTFNRTASGWSIKAEDGEEEIKEGEVAGEVKNE